MKTTLTIRGEQYEVEQAVIDYVERRTEERLGDYIRQIEGQLQAFKSRSSSDGRHVIKLFDDSTIQVSSETEKKVSEKWKTYRDHGKKSIINIRGIKFEPHQIRGIVPYRQHLQDQGFDGQTIEMTLRLSSQNSKPDNLMIEQVQGLKQLGGPNVHE